MTVRWNTVSWSTMRLSAVRSSTVRWSLLGACAFATSVACGSSKDPSTIAGGNGDGGSSGNGNGGLSPDGNGDPTLPGSGFVPDGPGDNLDPTPPCQGLECQQRPCSDGSSTTISGTVYDPSGRLELYNVMVYVPNAELEPLSVGASCNCEVSGSPVASAITDSSGHFVLENAPIGSDIPLVIQVGKWRRQFTVPAVAECADTTIPARTLRLPANRSQGDMPRIALTTGNADALECLLPKLGLDEGEFTTPAGGGYINYFAGHEGTDRYASSMNSGADFPPASELWGDVDTLKQYDVVLLSCEGQEYANEKGPAAFRAMRDYADLGGRVFASHWHQVWFKQAPQPWPQVASFVDEDDLNDITADVVTSFPKGKALSEWLVNVDATQTPGKIDIQRAQYTVLQENADYAQRWIYQPDPQSVQYISANTPFGASADSQCGRVVLSDIHVSGGDGGQDSSDSDIEYPGGCVSTDLSAQEKVLAFMLFDISGCVVPDTQPPTAPPIIPR